MISTLTRLILVGIFAAVSVARAEAMPRRIVSLNLCADQYLIALADREQIAALTSFARDPTLSYLAERAKSYPVSSGAAEAVIALKPDLLIGNPWGRAETRALLNQFDYETIELPPAYSFPDILAQTRRIAAAIGHSDRGERLIAEMEGALDRIPVNASIKRPVAVHYQRGGFVTGTQTLLDEIMERIGLDNLAAQIGDKSIARVSLERIVVANPDYLIFTTGLSNAQDQGTELLTHPVIKRQFGDARVLRVPESLTVCGGPSYPAAVAALSAQLSPRRDGFPPR